MNDNIVVIGIAGGTGSGKSTLISRIKEWFGDEVTVISHDFYYRDHTNIPLEERPKLNYDHPDAYETDLMIEQLKKLKEWEDIYRPVYSFVVHNRVDEKVLVKPSRVIVVEGILIFENEELRNLCDIKIFVDTDADVRILRRVQRDINERGRTLESVVNQYLTTVKPMHEKYVEPSKKYADLIVPEGGKNKVALDFIKKYIVALLK